MAEAGRHEAAEQPEAAPVSPAPAKRAAPSEGGDAIATIERLADLRDRGILTDEEFAKKKADLLDRL